MSPQERTDATAGPAKAFDVARRAGAAIPGISARVALPCIAVILGALQAWAVRHNPAVGDAVSYLDTGDAYLQGHWSVALNGYWSPLYPWLIGVARQALHPTPYWEFAVVRLVNFLVYLIALAAFERLLRQVLRARWTAAASVASGAPAGIGEAPLRVIAYAAFVWASRDLIKLSQLSPDMCVAAAVYAATGLLLRIAAGDRRVGTALALGAVLGVGYLAKTPLFPIGLVFLVLTAAVSYRPPRSWITPVLAALAFFALAAPLIAALSLKLGHLSFGESGRLNYAWYVAGVPSRHWQGGGSWGVAQHPTRVLLQRPEVYAFGRPDGVTYPLWYDPVFWYEGMRLPISLDAQIRASAATIAPRYVFSALAPARNEAWDIAEGMRRFGVRAGDRIATMSYANLDQVAWARLARPQVVAEVYDRPERPWDNDFWVLPAAERRSVLQALRSTGTRFATAVNVPPWITPAGWVRITGTPAYVRPLAQPEGEGSE